MRRLVEHLALFRAHIEELLRLEAERAGEQGGRELLDARVVLLHRVVEKAARGRDLVLDVGELGLQLLEVLAGLEVGIGLAQCEQLSQRAGKRVLGRSLRGNAARLRRHRGIACLHHRFQRAALVAGIALHGLHQVGDEVVALFGLHVDVGEGLVDPLPHGDEAVVDHHDPQRGDDDEADDDPGG